MVLFLRDERWWVHLVSSLRAARICEGQSAVKTIDGPLKVFAAAIKNRWEKWERKLKMQQGPRLELAWSDVSTFISWDGFNVQHGSNRSARNGKINILRPIRSKLVFQSLFLCGYHSTMNDWITFRKIWPALKNIPLKDLFPQIVLFQMKF